MLDRGRQGDDFFTRKRIVPTNRADSSFDTGFHRIIVGFNGFIRE